MEVKNIQYQSLNVKHDPSQIHECFHISIDDNVELFITISFTEIQNEVNCKNNLYSIIQTIQNSLFSKNEKDLYDKFEDTVKSLNLYLGTKDFQDIGRLHVAVGLLDDNVMYITKTGKAEIYLVRNNICTNVTANFDFDEESENIEIDTSIKPDSNINNSDGEALQNDIFNNIATGELEANDIVLITSNRLTKFVSEGELISLFGKSNIEIGFINMEHKLKEDSSSNITVIGFSNKQDNKPTDSISTNKPKTNIKDTLIAISKGDISMRSIWNKGEEFISRQKNNISNPEYKSKFITLGIVLLLIILVLSISISVNNKMTSESKIEIQQTQALANQELNKSKSAESSDKAREYLNNAKNYAYQLKSKNVAMADISKLLEDIATQEDIINKVNRFSEQNMFIDLNNKLGGDKPKGIINLGSLVYLYSSSAIFGPFVNNNTSSNKKYPVENNNLIVDGATLDDQTLIFKLSSNRLVEFINSSFKFSENTSGNWADGTDIEVFKNNVYILDGINTQKVWVYKKGKTSFTSLTPWLSQKDDDLKNAVSMTIDGSIYALIKDVKDAKIKKYFMGKEEKLNIVNFPTGSLENVDDKSQIITNVDWPYLFILNHGQNKIIVFNKSKDGSLVFDRLFINPDTEILNISATVDGRTIFALGNNLKIYKIDL